MSESQKRKREDAAPLDPGDREDGDVGKGSSMMPSSTNAIPSYPHPLTNQLAELSFADLLPENFFVIVYGVRRTGKTHAVSTLLEQIKDRFDFAYLFSTTAHLHKGQKGELDFEMIREEAKFEGYQEEILERIMTRQRAVLEHNNACKNKRDMKPNKTLLIFDDFVHETKIRYSKVFTQLPVLGRHFELSVICLSQGYSQVASGGLNKATRQNADLVMTFLPRNSNDLERISEWYLTKTKFENMWLTKSICQDEHRLMGIDLSQPHLVEFRDYVYTYKAPPEVPKYELGKVQWKIAREEAKRQRRAALEAKLEDAQTFFTTAAQMEIRSKLNQATGMPDNREKVTMFDAFRFAGVTTS